MTVREWIDEKKKGVKLNDIISNLESLATYGEETYRKSLDKEYDGDFEGADDDPWVGDILYCEKTIEILKALINHIENFEDKSADEVFKSLGVLR